MLGKAILSGQYFLGNAFLCWMGRQVIPMVQFNKKWLEYTLMSKGE